MGDETRRLLARNIRALRQQKGWSQEELAATSKLHRTYIGFVEREERNVTLRSVEKIAKALDAEPWQLLHPEMLTLTEQNQD